MIGAILAAITFCSSALGELSHVEPTELLSRYGHLCPDLPANLFFSQISAYHFYTTHAEISLSITPDSTEKTFLVIFDLPALPPFCRPAREYQPDPEYDRGNKNWAYAGTYVHDYAFGLIERSQLVNIHDETERVRCVYRSLAENHFIYGYIVTPKD